MLTLFSNHKFCLKIHGSNYLRNLSVTMIFAVLLLTILTISCASNVDGIQNLENSPIGDQPTLDKHVSQIAIDSGNVELDRLIEHGSLLFSAQFNSLMEPEGQKLRVLAIVLFVAHGLCRITLIAFLVPMLMHV